MNYFDNAATTRAYKEVAEITNKYLLEDFYNPSALYKKGLEVERDIDRARARLAKILGVYKDEIYFTPGGTWSNNLALRAMTTKNPKGKILTSKLEHSSVYEALKSLGEDRLVYLKNDSYGRVDLRDLEDKLEENIALVSIMQVNNELGSINDIGTIGRMLKDKKIPFHVDGVQGFCKYPLDLKKSGVDFYSLSAHKINGPKGIGALYVSKNYKLTPLAYGGGQEKGLVSGTENVAGIMGLAKAVELKDQSKDSSYDRVREMNLVLRKGLEKIPGYKINSPEDGSVYILNVAFEDIRSEVLIHMMSDSDYCISAGSACSKTKKSRVMEAIGLEDKYAEGPIRISLSHENTIEECQGLLQALDKNIKEIRKIIRR